MTDWSAARQAILNRFAGSYIPVAFADVSSGERDARYSFDNEMAEPPASVESWCRFTIQETDSSQASLGPVGARRFDRKGVARLELYCRSGNGMLKRDALVAAYRTYFEGVSFSGVHFTECQVVDAGVEGAWWRASALASFWFEQIK